jgi:hypothetical protein
MGSGTVVVKRYRILRDFSGSQDGLTLRFLAGTTRTLDDDLAQRALKQGVVELVSNREYDDYCAPEDRQTKVVSPKELK